MVVQSDSELESRKAFIEKVSGVKVSDWRKCECKYRNFLSKTVSYYICHSQKGQYGFVITAHMNLEVQAILMNEITRKKAIVAIDSCVVRVSCIKDCLSIVKQKNKNSELLFSKQEETDGLYKSFVDEVGEFGFPTTDSERELFQNRDKGLVKALRLAFDPISKYGL